MKALKWVLAAAAVLIVIAWLIPDAPGIRNPRPTRTTIVAFGDSLTYGTGAAPGMDYPAQLSNLIGRDIINAGVPGDTTASALARIEPVLAREPGIVLITLGGNDLKNGIERETAFANLSTIVSRFQDQGALVVIGGVDIPLLGRGFGSAYEQLARDRGCVLIPNVLKGLMGKPELMSDQIHPNSAGYTIMARRFLQALEPYL